VSRAFGEEFQETRLVHADRLALSNLVGTINVVGHDGPSFEVVIDARGAEATREALRIDETDGTEATVRIGFVAGGAHRFTYPLLSRGTVVSFTDDWLRDDLERAADGVLRKTRGRTVFVSGKRSGLEAWADVTVRVPAGKVVLVRTGVGDVTGRSLRASLNAKTECGDIVIEACEGDVVAECGSGEMTFQGLRGTLEAKSGDGDLEIHDGSGGALQVETGNGFIVASSLNYRTTRLETGNGKLRLSNLEGEDARAETGNGSIEIELGSRSPAHFEATSGNGSIRLRLREEASVEVDATSGSGSVHVGVEGPNVTIHEDEHDHASLRAGSGDGQVRLATGRGTIRITR
jgi:hypothetical protein